MNSDDLAHTSVEAKDDRKARVVVEYVDAPESDDEAPGEDPGDPATEDLLAAMPDNTEVSRVGCLVKYVYSHWIGY